MKILKVLTTSVFALALLAMPAFAEHKQADCCAKAVAAGKTCEHKCCVEAAKAGKECTKCGGEGDIHKKDAGKEEKKS